MVRGSHLHFRNAASNQSDVKLRRRDGGRRMTMSTEMKRRSPVSGRPEVIRFPDGGSESTHIKRDEFLRLFGCSQELLGGSTFEFYIVEVDLQQLYLKSNCLICVVAELLTKLLVTCTR